jgi:hypothetical protein
MCSAQGFNARVGGEGRSDLYPHSADLMVYNVGAPGAHIRVDVKSGAEYGKSAISTLGPKARAYTSKREADCHRSHSPIKVLPFVLTAMGQMGDEAVAFINLIHRLSGGRINGGLEPTPMIPNCEHYWHKRLRAYVMVGTAAMIRAVLGCSPGEFNYPRDIPTDFVVSEVERLTEVVAVARASPDHAYSETSTVIIDDDSAGDDDDDGDGAGAEASDPDDSGEGDNMNMGVDTPHGLAQPVDQSPDTPSWDEVDEALGPDPMTSAAALAHGIPLIPTLGGGLRPAGFCCDRSDQLEGHQCLSCGAPVGPPEDWLLYDRLRLCRAPSVGVAADL